MKKAKSLMTFGMTNEVIEQRQVNAEKRQAAHEKARAATAKLALMRQQYEAAIMEGVESGEENTEKLKELENAISQAETDAKRAKEAEAIASRIYQYAIDKKAFNAAFSKFKGDYYNAEVLPILEELREYKKGLTLLMRKYQKTVDHYENERTNARLTMDPSGMTIFFGGSIEPQTMQELHYYFVTAKTLEDLQARRVPQGVELDEDEKKGGRN